MKVLAQRIWNEPAVCIGLLTSLVLLALNFATGDDWSADAIIAILAPIISALGIRQVVYSPNTVEELTAPETPKVIT